MTDINYKLKVCHASLQSVICLLSLTVVTNMVVTYNGDMVSRHPVSTMEGDGGIHGFPWDATGAESVKILHHVLGDATEFLYRNSLSERKRNTWGQFLEVLSPLEILNMKQKMVAKVISELKSVSRLKIFFQKLVHAGHTF